MTATARNAVHSFRTIASHHLACALEARACANSILRAARTR